MEKKNEKLIPVCIYCDSTGLFSEEECCSENLTDMLFPEWIVREWYKENEKACIEDCKAEHEEPCFENWINNSYTADGTDGLYDFAVQKGFDPFFCMSEGHKDAVIYEDHEGKTIVVFKGKYLDCRKWAREHKWKYEYYYTSLETLEEEEEEVDLFMLFG